MKQCLGPARRRATVLRLGKSRHTYATLLLQAGPREDRVQAARAQLGITLDTYAYAIPGLQPDAAEQVGILCRLPAERQREDPHVG
jgi:hypothetical protein